MKRPIEKKQRPGRKKPKGRKTIASDSKEHLFSDTRRIIRKNTDLPNSSKIGAGPVTARRSLSHETIHRRNHRTAEMIGYKY